MKSAFLYIYIYIWNTSLKMDSQVYFKNKFKEKFYSPLPLNEEKVFGESFFILFYFFTRIITFKTGNYISSPSLQKSLSSGFQRPQRGLGHLDYIQLKNPLSCQHHP